MMYVIDIDIFNLVSFYCNKDIKNIHEKNLDRVKLNIYKVNKTSAYFLIVPLLMFKILISNLEHKTFN